MKYSKWKYCMILIAAMILSGCTEKPAQSLQTDILSPSQDSTAPSSNRKLTISATVDEETPFNTFSREELGNNYPYDLAYYELTDVSILVGSEVIPLEEAIKNGSVTIEELVAYTQIDARNGICTATSETSLGLTMYVYVYPEYKVHVYYDIFEAPDGRQHQISHFMLLNPDLNHSISTSFTDWDSEYGYQLDREDWGITLDVVEATPTEITLRCTHAGGQHFGELKSTQYTLFTANWEAVLSPEGFAGGICEDITIQQNTESTFTVSWEESHGELLSGEYYLKLWFTDVYDAADLHPLTRNYRNNQPYVIPFVIP